MDDSTAVLQKKLANLLREAAEIKVALDRGDGRVQGVPHYSVIEDAAHELGRELSRKVQALHLAELVAQQPTAARCPGCGTRCELRPKERSMCSGDGLLELQEMEGHCPRCRRSFFPSAGEARV